MVQDQVDAIVDLSQDRRAVRRRANDCSFSRTVDWKINPVLYVQERTDALPHVLIDPYSFSKDGLIPIVDQSPSADGRLHRVRGGDAGVVDAVGAHSRRSHRRRMSATS